MALTKTPIELSSTQGIVDNSNATAITIDSSENVGIGVVPAAGYRMDILGGSGYDDIMRITGVGTNIGPRINLAPTGTGISRINATANSLQLQTSGTPALTIDSSQNVGIGGATTTIGSAAASTNVEFNMNGVASKALRIQFQEGGVNRWLLGQGAASETSAFELYNAGGVMALSVDRTTNVATFASGAVFNEDSADADFRVESDSNTHMVFVDASTNKVGINASAPEATLDVKTDLAITEVAAANATSQLVFYSRFSDSQRGFVVLKAQSLASGSSDLIINTRNNFNDTQRLRIAANGKIQISNDIPIWSGSYGGAVFLKGNNATAARNARLCIVTSTGAQDGDKELILDNDGDVTVKGGDLIFGTAGKGVVLGATTNTAANTLDDYEEGTWTPILALGSHSYSEQLGKYTKIGNQITVWGRMILSSRGSSTSELGIGGLPIAGVGSPYASTFGMSNTYGTAGLLPSGVAPTGGSIEGSIAYLRNQFATNNSYTYNQLNSAGGLTFAFTYMTA